MFVNVNNNSIINILFYNRKNEIGNKNDKFYLVCFCKPKICHRDLIKNFMIELGKN